MKPLSRYEINDLVSNLPPAIIDPKVMKILFYTQYKQRTDEWYEKRKEILTASDAAAALDLNKYQSRVSLLMKKCGLTPNGNDSATSEACQHGIKYEDEAADTYGRMNPHLCPFFEVGLVIHPDYPFIGASPDRITKDGILIEIKVP